MSATAVDVTPELGVLAEVPFEGYINGPGLSKSTLAALLDTSPLHVHRGVKKESDALRMGSMLHCLTLEPEAFEDRYAIEPDVDAIKAKSPRATKEYKDALAEIRRVCPGAEIVRRDEYEMARRIADGIRSHGVFKNLLGGDPLVERTIYWNEPVYDGDTKEHVPVLCKARPDALRERDEDVIVVDLKSTRDAGPRAFGRQSVNLRYHMSAYMTSRAVFEVFGKPVTWIAFAFEKSPPYCTASYVYTADELHAGPWVPKAQAVAQAMHVGKRETHEALQLWLRCEKSGRWPGYNDGRIVPITIPTWKKREHEEDEYANAPEEPF